VPDRNLSNWEIAAGQVKEKKLQHGIVAVSPMFYKRFAGMLVESWRRNGRLLSLATESIR